MTLFESLRKEYEFDGAIPKEHWPKQATDNRDIIGVFYSKKLECCLHMAPAKEKYMEFCVRVKLGVEPIIEDKIYRQIIGVPTEKGKPQLNLQMFSTFVSTFENKDFCLTLVPYNEGVMIQGIYVKDDTKKGKGIGTKIINHLYELSERMDIPLYLTPYPDENNPDLDILWKKIYRLRNWYEGLGFGPVFDTPWIWSNYFEEDIK
jgi:hypothetical protein